MRHPLKWPSSCRLFAQSNVEPNFDRHVGPISFKCYSSWVVAAHNTVAGRCRGEPVGTPPEYGSRRQLPYRAPNRRRWFGITYAAEDIRLGTTVAVKEYYPDAFGDRDADMSVRPKSDRHKPTFDWGRVSFIEEARTLARFQHSSIVRVSQIFEAHSTAYMVMDFER